MRVRRVEPSQESRVRGGKLRLDPAKCDKHLTARRPVNPGRARGVEAIRDRSANPQRLGDTPWNGVIRQAAAVVHAGTVAHAGSPPQGRRSKIVRIFDLLTYLSQD